MSRVLAFDFGASSGRAILGAYENGELSYQEVHRFENNPRDKDGHFRWDFEDLLANVRLGAQKAGPVDSLAFDTWGVDFGLLDAQGRLLEDPVHYRDQRTAGLVEEAFQSLPAGALYGATGTQILNINSLYQLLALQRQEPQLWEKAHRLLFMPDLFAWALCGAQACETTIASTSQLLDPRSQSWSQQVLSAFHIPQELFAPLVKSGTVVGEYQGAKVIAAAGHDTQCAVAALPAPEKDAAFLSCGTWSLLGTELPEPITTPESLARNFTNEGGYRYRFRYLKNIMGLWMLQSIRREAGEGVTFNALEQAAREAASFPAQVDVGHSRFLAPENMGEAVRDACRETGQPVPQTLGELAACVYHSLAYSYAQSVQELSALTGREYTAVNIVGGGSRDGYLNQLTANATGLPVYAGPTEGTALGNLMVQMLAAGEFPDLAAIRKAVRHSFSIQEVLPC